MKIESVTTATFSVEASNPKAFDVAIDFLKVAAERGHATYKRDVAVARPDMAPEDRYCVVVLTSTDAEHLDTLLTALTQAFLLLDVRMGE